MRFLTQTSPVHRFLANDLRSWHEPKVTIIIVLFADGMIGTGLHFLHLGTSII